MKPISAFPTAALLVLAACVPQPRSAPPVQTSAAVPLQPTPAPLPPAASNWLDAPLSDGNWFYRNEGAQTLALFGGKNTEAEFYLRCEPGARRIVLARASEANAPVAMRIRAESAERVLTARPDGGDLPFVGIALAANDSLLDAMALSKGRFAVEVPGSDPLYLPSWAEVSRVIEDCR